MFLLFKALHLIGMVTWFAGLFYMFRLFVYHVENAKNADITTLLKVMEKRLYYYITFPAFISTILFGAILLLNSSYNLTQSWFLIKLVLVIALSGYHFFIGYTLRRLKKNEYFLTSKQCRILNEVPTLFLVSIVFIAVFRSYIG